MTVDVVNVVLRSEGKMAFRSIIILVIVALAEPASAGRTLPDHESRLPSLATSTVSFGSAKAPWGWTDFCERHRDECSAVSTTPSPIILTAMSWSTIERVNREVNSMIREADDLETYGMEERWDYPNSGLGDCEDFALLKRKSLIELGFPKQALLMTVVTDENGMGHAILTIQTNRGDFVLDNRTNHIFDWHGTGYAFVKRQSAENPNIWVRIGIPNAPNLTATGQH